MKDLNICIIGCGYIGMNILEESMKYTNNIMVCEINKEKLDSIKHNIKKCIYVKNLKPFDTETFYFICVDTPLVKSSSDESHLSIDNIIEVFGQLSNKLKKNDTIIIESTINPNNKNIEELINIIESNTKFKNGVDINIVLSPERVSPIYENTANQNKILVKHIATLNVNEQILKLKNFYKSIYKDVVLLSNNTYKPYYELALSKLVENAQRDVLIAFQNSVKIISEKFLVNYDNIIDICKTKYNYVNEVKTGLVGGACIPAASETLNSILPNSIFKTARTINTEHIHEHLLTYLISKYVSTTSKKLNVLIYGASYKANIGELKNSNNLDFIKTLDSYTDIFNIVVVDGLIPDNKRQLTSKIKAITKEELKKMKFKPNEILYLAYHDIDKN